MKQKFFDGLGKIKNQIGNAATAASNLIVDDPNWNRNINIILDALSSYNPNTQSNTIKSNLKSNSYYNSTKITSNPILLIAVVSFHHKKGSIVEFTYPEKEEILTKEDTVKYISSISDNPPKKVFENILEQLTYLCLPDGTHAVSNDSQFFLIQNFKTILYGISCYKQLRVTQAMKEDDQENTRECVQKAMCIVSQLPLFGQMASKLSVTMDAFFNQQSLKDKSIIQELYANYEPVLFKSIKINEILTSFSLCKLINMTKEKVFDILKYAMLEKRILVYSHISHNVCSFIFSLLSLIPRNSLFNCDFGDDVKNYNRCFEKYGLPLKFLNNDSKLYSLITLYDVDKIENCKSFIIGTTNQLFLTFDKYKYDCIVNIDENQIILSNKKSNSTMINKLSKYEKNIYKKIQEKIKDTPEQYYSLNNSEINKDMILNTSFDECEDFIRLQFKNYILTFLVDVSFIQFVSTNKNIVQEDKIAESKKVLSKYNTEFVAQWTKSKNFQYWLYQHDSELFKRSNKLNKVNNVTIYYENGDCYVGELSFGLREGNGSLTSYDNKYVYEGKWEKNKKNGYGHFLDHGIQYNGIFKDDLYNGTGVLIDKEGNIYEGDFLNGFIEGIGHYSGRNKDLYVGNFHKGLFEGKGQLTYHNGDLYNGEFKDGKKSGNGVLIYSNGSKYEGLFDNDKPALNDNYICK